jgi:hypothetical protein
MIILPNKFIFYGEDHPLSAVRDCLFNIFAATLRIQWDYVTGGWRKLHDEELHNLHSSTSIIGMIKKDEMGRVGSTNGAEECI